MVFSSLTFVFAFLPAVIILYFAVKNRTWRNAVLLLSSLIFYSWGEPKHIFLMIAATAVAYAGGWGIHSAKESGKRISCKIIYIGTLVLLVANLFVFKYLNFAENVFASITGTKAKLGKIALPIGISFYTFQILSYVIDLYRGEVELQRNPFSLLLYVSFFPRLIAGPIVRYQTVEEEISSRKENLEDISEGIKRFIVGLAKKVLLANNISAAMNIIYDGAIETYGTLLLWVAAVAYTIQIYYDFSGYSDMAIGIGRIFGFHFLENFNYPYNTHSVTDYWRNWHISLSSWFRDYVYIPLGGNRVGKWRWILNIIIVWAMTGLWHGAEWNFPLWGLYYGVILVLEKLVIGKLLKKLPKFLSWFYMFFVITVGFVLFNMTEPSRYAEVMRAMFVPVPTNWPAVMAENINIVKTAIWMPLGMIFIFPVKAKLGNLLHEKCGQAANAVECVICVLLFLLCVVYMLSTTYNPFIYFRF